MYYTNKLKICIKDEKFEILHFNRYVKKHKYIHNLLNLYSNTVSKRMCGGPIDFRGTIHLERAGPMA